MENRVKDPEWFGNANCATSDPEVMFPEKGRSLRAAREICRRCVVQEDCLTAAVIEKDREGGFRANMTAKERRAYMDSLE